MVLPIVTKRKIDPGLQDPDLLAVPLGLQRRLTAEKVFTGDTVVGFGSRLISDIVQAGKDANFGLTSKEDPVKKQKILTAEEANQRFGISDRLRFNTPVSEEAAQRKQIRIQKQMIIEQQLSFGDEQNTLGDKINLFFTGALPVQAVDSPLMELKIWGTAARALKIGRGFEAVGGSLAKGALKNPFIKAGIKNGLETAAMQPFIKANYDYYGLDYGISEATQDVLFGTGIGVGLKALGVAFHAPKILRKRQTRLDLRKEVIREHLSSNINGLMGVINKTFTTNNPSSIPDMVSSIIALDHHISMRRLDDNGLFHSDFVLRQDLDSLSPEMKFNINERLHTESIIPSSRINSPDRIANLAETQPYRFKEFPELHQRILQKIDPTTKAITYKDLVDILKSALNKTDLSNNQFKKLIAQEFGIKTKRNRDLISTKEAFTIANLLDNKARLAARKAGASAEDLIPALKSFREQLKAQPSITKYKNINDFIKDFKKAKHAVFKDPELSSKTLKEFSKLTDIEQAKILNYLRFIQEADISGAEMDQLLSGNRQMFKLIQERAKFKKEVIDSNPPQEAYDLVRQNMRKLDDDSVDPDFLHTDDPDLRKGDELTEDIIDRHRAYLTEDEIIELETQNKLEEKIIDDHAEANELVARCLTRGIV